MTTKSKRSTSQRAKVDTKQKNTASQGHTVPKIIEPDSNKLALVMNTLKQNLQAIPMTQWDEPIMQALKSAFILGQAEGVAGEDRALETSPAQDPMDKGYLFIDSIAKHFGTREGLQPHELSFKWIKLQTSAGEMLVFLPTAPLHLSGKL